MTDIIVIGGGAAGMLAAIRAAQAGARVTLLERNEKLGKKIYITGKGRCNVTNAAERDVFFANIPRNPRFLYAAFSHLSNLDWMDTLESWGVPLKVERGERVFPQSDHASDITRAMERELKKLGVDVRFFERVTDILTEENRITAVMTESGKRLPCKAVILATGGASYPTTGPTGDGYRLCETLGHRIKTPLPALCPIETQEIWPKELTGLSLKNVTLSAWKGNKAFYSEMGEMLFTHFGISGPLALTLSSMLDEKPTGTRLTIDLKPALDEETLDKRLLRELSSAPNKRMISIAETLAPRSLAAQLIRSARIPADLPAHSLTRAQRDTFLHTIKALPLTVKGLRGMNEAIVTRGGVDVRDVNPSTLASKKIDGLYLCGELLDVDAYTGGFNLQIAFSTGSLAGASAGAFVMESLG